MGNPSQLVPPTVIPPALGPLAASAEADQIEADMKAAFLEVFAAMLRPAITRINTYGMAHRGDFETVERFVKADGLALDRRTDREAFMRELYRGWRAHNPRRGLMFLRHYLQLLYPGASTVDQLWHHPTAPYPVNSSIVETVGWFLTSRIRVGLTGGDALSDVEVKRLRGIFLSIIPARLVLEMYVLLGGGFTAGVGCYGAFTGAQRLALTGTAAP
jgi:hypothetical protein